MSFDAVHGLAKAYLLPEKLNAAHDNLSPLHRDRLLRATEESGVRAAYRAMLPGVEEVRGEVIVLVCGHRGRDGRCGVMGPVLREEFGSQLARAGVEVRKEPRPFNDGGDRGRSEPKLVSPEGYAGARADASLCVADRSVSARVGLISHIGGHKYAGNVIVYVPPDAVLRGSGAPHPLAGCGVWYGRVEPRHVEGIVAETVLGGRVIAELFRGAIGRDRSIVRL